MSSPKTGTTPGSRPRPPAGSPPAARTTRSAPRPECGPRCSRKWRTDSRPWRRNETGSAGAGRGRAVPVVLAVTATGREAEDLTEALRAFLPAETIAEFPSWETLPHERLSPRSDTVGRRLSVLRRLAHPESATAGALRVVVAPVRAVVQPIVAGLGELVPVTLKVGQEAPFSGVVKSLADAAYARVDMVTRRGEFAVRGGMLDVFPPTEDHPIRVEFFGDEVDQMRWFAVADQRSLTAPGLHHPTELHAPPCREILITPSVMSRAATLKSQLPAAADMLEKIAGGIAVEGMESLAPVLVDAMVPFLDQLPAGSIAVVIEPEKVRTRAHDLAATNEEFLEAAWSTASDGGTAPLDLNFRGVRGPALGQLPFADRNPHRRPRARRLLVVHHVTGQRRGAAARRRRAEPARPGTPRLPGRRGGNDGLHRLPRPGPVADRRGHRGPGPGAAPRRTLPRQRHPVRAGGHARGRSAGRADRGDHRRRRPRFCPGSAQAGAADRGGPAGPDLRRFHEGHAPDAVQAAERRGSAAARGRGLRGARTARHRPVRGTDPAQGCRWRRGHARIPGPGIRPVQARGPGRPALRAHRPAGPGHPVRGRRHPGAEQDGRRGLGEHQVQGPQGGQGDRRRADPAVLGPDGLPRLRVRPRTPRGSGNWRRPSHTWRPRTS